MRIDLEIAVARQGPADANRFVRLRHMQRIGVGIGIDRDGAQAHAPGRPDDPAGDLAAIGDEDGLEHLTS